MTYLGLIFLTDFALLITELAYLSKYYSITVATYLLFVLQYLESLINFTLIINYSAYISIYDGITSKANSYFG
jgi:hypothetical protein